MDARAVINMKGWRYLRRYLCLKKKLEMQRRAKQTPMHETIFFFFFFNFLRKPVRVHIKKERKVMLPVEVTPLNNFPVLP